MWNRIANILFDYRWVVLSLTVIFTVFFGYWSFQVKTDQKGGGFISEESPEYKAFVSAGKKFGFSQGFIYAVIPFVDSLSNDYLDGLKEMSAEMEAEDGIEYVLSLANPPRLEREGSALVSAGPSSANEIREQLKKEPLLSKLLLSRDGKATLFALKLENDIMASGSRVSLVNQFTEVLESKFPGSYMVGYPFLRTQYTNRIKAETPLFTVLAILISIVLLYLMFRSIRAVILTTIVVICGLIWTFGLLGVSHQDLSIVTAMLPPLIVVIGMATAIHIASKYYTLFEQMGDKRAALVATIETTGYATFLTSLTTVVGFGVLIFSGSTQLTIFGKYASAGVAMVYILTMGIMPITYFLSRKPSIKTLQFTHGDRLIGFFDALFGIVSKRAGRIILAFMGLAVIGVVGITKVSSDVKVFSDFKDDDQVNINVQKFEKSFGGVLPMDVVIESKRPGQFRSNRNLNLVSTLDQKLSELEEVERSLSIADVSKAATQAFLGGHESQYRMPSGRELPFLLRSLRSQNGENGLANIPGLVDSTYSSVRISLGVPDLGTSKMTALVSRVDSLASEVFNSDQFKVIVTGNAVTSTLMGKGLLINLLYSLFLALIAISVVMAFLFKSVKLVLLSIIPNVIPLLFVAGAMGYFDVGLRLSTMLIFPLAFGIAVDDSIHFLAKYRILRKAGKSTEVAVHQTLRETGKAIFYTSVVLSVGFSIFVFSGFGGNAILGGMTALTLIIALVTNLLLLPALMIHFDK